MMWKRQGMESRRAKAHHLLVLAGLIVTVSACWTDPGPLPLMPRIRNDLNTSVVVELRSANYHHNVVVPAKARAMLGYQLTSTMTAKVFRPDCSSLATVQLTPDRRTIWVHLDGRIEVQERDPLDYTVPSPAMTEFSLGSAAEVPGCSGDYAA